MKFIRKIICAGAAFALLNSSNIYAAEAGSSVNSWAMSAKLKDSDLSLESRYLLYYLGNYAPAAGVKEAGWLANLPDIVAPVDQLIGTSGLFDDESKYYDYGFFKVPTISAFFDKDNWFEKKKTTLKLADGGSDDWKNGRLELYTGNLQSLLSLEGAELRMIVPGSLNVMRGVDLFSTAISSGDPIDSETAHAFMQTLNEGQAKFKELWALATKASEGAVKGFKITKSTLKFYKNAIAPVIESVRTDYCAEKNKKNTSELTFEEKESIDIISLKLRLSCDGSDLFQLIDGKIESMESIIDAGLTVAKLGKSLSDEFAITEDEANKRRNEFKAMFWQKFASPAGITSAEKYEKYIKTDEDLRGEVGAVISDYLRVNKGRGLERYAEVFVYVLSDFMAQIPRKKAQKYIDLYKEMGIRYYGKNDAVKLVHDAVGADFDSVGATGEDIRYEVLVQARRWVIGEALAHIIIATRDILALCPGEEGSERGKACADVKHKYMSAITATIAPLLFDEAVGFFAPDVMRSWMAATIKQSDAFNQLSKVMRKKVTAVATGLAEIAAGPVAIGMKAAKLTNTFVPYLWDMVLAPSKINYVIRGGVINQLGAPQPLAVLTIYGADGNKYERKVDLINNRDLPVVLAVGEKVLSVNLYANWPELADTAAAPWLLNSSYPNQSILNAEVVADKKLFWTADYCVRNQWYGSAELARVVLTAAKKGDIFTSEELSRLSKLGYPRDTVELCNDFWFDNYEYNYPEGGEINASKLISSGTFAEWAKSGVATGLVDDKNALMGFLFNDGASHNISYTIDGIVPGNFQLTSGRILISYRLGEVRLTEVPLPQASPLTISLKVFVESSVGGDYVTGDDARNDIYIDWGDGGGEVKDTLIHTYKEKKPYIIKARVVHKESGAESSATYNVFAPGEIVSAPENIVLPYGSTGQDVTFFVKDISGSVVKVAWNIVDSAKNLYQDVSELMENGFEVVYTAVAEGAATITALLYNTVDQLVGKLSQTLAIVSEQPKISWVTPGVVSGTGFRQVFTITAENFLPEILNFSLNDCQNVEDVTPEHVNKEKERSFGCIFPAETAPGVKHGTITDAASTSPFATAGLNYEFEVTLLPAVSNEGWIANPANGREYKVVDCGTWTSCEEAAVSLGGHLATIRSQAENDWIAANFPVDKNYWIGLTDAAAEGTWKWSSGDTVNYVNWVIGEPNNGYGGVSSENYVHINFNYPNRANEPGKWNDVQNDISVTVGAGGVPYSSKALGLLERSSSGRAAAMSGQFELLAANESGVSVNFPVTAASCQITAVGSWSELGGGGISADGHGFVRPGTVATGSALAALVAKTGDGSYSTIGSSSNINPAKTSQMEFVFNDMPGQYADNSGSMMLRYHCTSYAEDGWITNPANGHLYKLDTCGTWTDCQAKASSFGAKLVTIDDAAENAWLTANVLPAASSIWGAWMGLLLRDDGIWVWDSLEVSSYLNWAVGEPNNSGLGETRGHIMKDGFWNDLAPGWSAPSQGIFEMNTEASSVRPLIVASNKIPGATFVVPTNTSTCQFVATGEWTAGPPPWSMRGPDGDSGTTSYELTNRGVPLPSAPFMSLVAKRSSTDQWQLIGSAATITVTGGETLSFMANDATDGGYTESDIGNRGQLSVTYSCQ